MATASATAEANKVANANTTKLLKVADDVTKIVEALKHTTNIHDDLSQAIAEKEVQLNQLETQFKEEARRRQVEMDLDFKEREAQKVAQVLAAQGKQAANTVEFNTLVAEFNALKSEFKQKLEEEAGKIRQSEAAKSAAAIKQAQLELQVKEATNAAALTSLNDKNSLLQAQVNQLIDQVNAERDARIQEAKARGAAMVTVNSSK